MLEDLMVCPHLADKLKTQTEISKEDILPSSKLKAEILTHIFNRIKNYSKWNQDDMNTNWKYYPKEERRSLMKFLE